MRVLINAKQSRRHGWMRIFAARIGTDGAAARSLPHTHTQSGRVLAAGCILAHSRAVGLRIEK